ncbi:hypothetical protein BDE02_11G063700 [Populus trichocarpa]|nr:hypothetical protein BDE02_11G063700 [Populus trichocarpa]
MNWTRGRTIGHGSSATVSMAKANRSGQVFAVKSAELLKSESLQREQSILSTLKCPQIVVYKGCDITNENGKCSIIFSWSTYPVARLSMRFGRAEAVSTRL